ncbi:MAG TPA: hypothetical protein VEX13_15190 [Chloroflexia bacterium]|nr:hypothetical protein [Chloroflexia bacterium]
MQAYVLRARLPQLQRPVGRPIGNLLIGVSCTGLLMYEMVRWGIGALIFLLWVAVLGVALMLIIYLAGRVASTARVRRALQRLLLPLARRAGSLVTRVLAFLDMSPTRPVSLYQVERVADREVVGVEILNQNRQPLLLAAHRDAVVYFIGYEREEQGILTFDALLAVPVDSQGYLLGMPIVSVRPLHWGWGMVSIVVAVLLATVI